MFVIYIQIWPTKIYVLGRVVPLLFPKHVGASTLTSITPNRLRTRAFFAVGGFSPSQKNEKNESKLFPNFQVDFLNL